MLCEEHLEVPSSDAFTAQSVEALGEAPRAARYRDKSIRNDVLEEHMLLSARSSVFARGVFKPIGVGIIMQKHHE